MVRKIVATLAFILACRVAVPAAQVVPADGVRPDPQPSVSNAASERHRAFVDLAVDQEPRGKVLAAFDDTDVFLTPSDLQRYGIPVKSATCISIAGTCYVALSSLGTAIAYTFDRAKLVLSITLAPALLPKKTVQLGLARPATIDNEVRGNVLDYSVNAVANSQVAGVLDDRFGLGKDEVLQGGVGRTTTGLVQRTYTNLVADAPQDQRRTTVGDAEATGGDVGGSFEFGGIAVQRQFSLDPYSIYYPTPTLQTAVTQPSQAQIYVNGTLVKTIALPPGYYTLSDIPVVAGYSNAQVVIRNAFGQATFNTGTYGAISLLKKGLTDYQYGLGVLRENIGLPTDTYGPAVVTAGYRLGLSDQATLGGLIQSSNGLENAGVDYDAQIGAGVLHTAAGTSIGSNRNGLTGAIAYTTTSSTSGFAIALTAQSKNYTRISSFGPVFQTSQSAVVAWSRQIARSASINISEQVTHYVSDGTFKQTNFGLSQNMGPWTLSGSYSIATSPAALGIAGGTTHSVAVSLIRTIGSRANTSMTESFNVQTGPGAASGYQLTSSALTPLDSSYNAVVQTRPGGGAEFGGWANLASPYGTLDLALSPGGSLSSVSGSLNGAVVSTPKGTFFTQAVEDAYALVDTGAPGAPVYLSGMYVGTTNRSGAMVVPFLQSYLANTISISNGGLPLTEIIQGPGSTNAAPGYHNGTLVSNPVERVHALVGKVLLTSAGADIVPMYGDAQLVLSNAHYSSPIDEQGRIYFQGVLPGSYRLTITLADKTCATSIDVPDFEGPTYNLGTVRCQL